MITGKDKRAFEALNRENMAISRELRQWKEMVDSMLEELQRRGAGEKTLDPTTAKRSPSPFRGADAGDGWISAEERMPEPEETVLAVIWGRINCVEYEGGIIFAAWDGEEWYDDSMPCADAEFRVTYWMPLPELPEGESERAENG